MYTQEITVNNEVGLHARPATYFIQKANEFKCGIWVEKDERRVNAKSLLGDSSRLYLSVFRKKAGGQKKVPVLAGFLRENPCIRHGNVLYWFRKVCY